MGQSVSIAPFTGRDGFGAATYGAAVSYPARVVGKVRQVRDARGQEVVSSQTVYVMTDQAFTPLDKVTLSTGFVNSTEADRTTPPIVATARYPGADGQPHHSVLFLV